MRVVMSNVNYTAVVLARCRPTTNCAGRSCQALDHGCWEPLRCVGPYGAFAPALRLTRLGDRDQPEPACSPDRREAGTVGAGCLR